MENPIEPGRKLKPDTITFRRSTFFAALLPIAFALGLAAGYVFWGLNPPADKTAQTVSAVPTAVVQDEQAVRRYDVPEEGNYAFGPEDAPITIIEFSDYECPFCRKWHAETWKPLREQYGDKIRLVYRDLPLSNIHPNAIPAAEAANCAGEQGQYYPFHEKLLDNENLGQAVYEQYAADLMLDMDQFKECVSTRKYQDEVQADIDYAINLGITSTPTFFINGIPLVGAQPLSVFQQVIEKEIAGEIP